MVEPHSITISTQTNHKENLSLHSQVRRNLIVLDFLYRKLLLAGFESPTQFESARLSVQEGRTFVFLAYSGDTNMSKFAKSLGLPISTATRLVDKLVREGMVIRRRSAHDHRVINIELSSQGKKLERLFMRRRLPVIREMLASLTERENKILLDLIEKIL